MLWYSGIFANKKESDKVLVVDFDRTIAEDKYPDIGQPLPHVIDALSTLRQAGYEIVIFTCRLTRDDSRPKSEIEEQKEKIEKWLKEYKVPYDRIDDGRNGKVHARYYIDDKNIEYRGGADWERICEHILGKDVLWKGK